MDHSKTMCDIGHVLGLVGVMWMMSRLGEVIGVGVVLVALWMSSREREGNEPGQVGAWW